MSLETPRHNEAACIKLFENFFINTQGLLSEFAPDGWENSPLFLAFHPTPQQCYQEALRFHRNITSLFKNKENQQEPEAPKLSDFLNQEPDKEINPIEEIINLVGLCLWDIFSDNHEVISVNGKVYDTGSFRGSGGFIAEYINEHFPELESRYDYLDFYMGTFIVQDRADLLPVYMWIFKHLRSLECDWIYSFPRIYAISFNKEDMETPSDPLEYDPNKALEEEFSKQEKKAEVDRLQQELEEAYQQEAEEAKYKPLPKTVQAYKNVYGRLPKGWPHQAN
jgi:hypothetical protein